MYRHHDTYIKSLPALLDAANPGAYKSSVSENFDKEVADVSQQEEIATTDEAAATGTPPTSSIKSEPTPGTYRHRLGSRLELLGIASPDLQDERGEFLGTAVCHDYVVDSVELPLSLGISKDSDGYYWYFAENPYGKIAVFHPAGMEDMLMCMSLETFVGCDGSGKAEFTRIEKPKEVESHLL